MRRSVRNGLAIAGMAGGMWFLGHAVANASETSTPDAQTQVTQQSSSTGPSSASNSNVSSNSASASNTSVTKVQTGDITAGSGGHNEAQVNTGVLGSGPAVTSMTKSEDHGDEHHGAPTTSVTVNSGDVSATQQANGGDVNHSGNVHVTPSAGDQTASATATTTVDQTATSTAPKGEEHHHGDGHGPWNNDSHGQQGSSGNSNVSDNSANASNKDITKVQTGDITAGNGGSNYADINTGLIGTNFYCPKGGCTYNITTGDVTLLQQANGGSVNGSGNVNIGPAAQPSGQKPSEQPSQKPCKKEAAKPAVAPAAAPTAAVPTAAKVSPVSSAQPTGTLATTGSDIELPLTAGLLALGLGVGLTAAGRRRRELATV